MCQNDTFGSIYDKSEKQPMTAQIAYWIHPWRWMNPAQGVQIAQKVPKRAKNPFFTRFGSQRLPGAFGSSLTAGGLTCVPGPTCYVRAASDPITWCQDADLSEWDLRAAHVPPPVLLIYCSNTAQMGSFWTPLKPLFSCFFRVARPVWGVK